MTTRDVRIRRRWPRARHRARPFAHRFATSSGPRRPRLARRVVLGGFARPHGPAFVDPEVRRPRRDSASSWRPFGPRSASGLARARRRRRGRRGRERCSDVRRARRSRSAYPRRTSRLWLSEPPTSAAMRGVGGRLGRRRSPGVPGWRHRARRRVLPRVSVRQAARVRATAAKLREVATGRARNGLASQPGPDFGPFLRGFARLAASNFLDLDDLSRLCADARRRVGVALGDCLASAGGAGRARVRRARRARARRRLGLHLRARQPRSATTHRLHPATLDALMRSDHLWVADECERGALARRSRRVRARR